jgi:hypothetical protein
MENNLPQMNNYLADIKIIKGLYLTFDIEKIIRNCDYFEIEIPSNLSNISKRNKTSILTLRISDYEFIQFNVKWNLNIKQLQKLDNESLPKEIKPLILQAYELAKMQSLRDLFI